MKTKILLGIGVLVIIVGGLMLAVSMSPTKKLKDVSVNPSQKPIVLLVIDSLMSEQLQEVIKEEKAPAFSYLMDSGQFFPDFISSYPTMSVTIDSTLLTGTYANEHKVPGLIWFKEDEERMVSYGSGIREMWDNGIKKVASDSVIHLNESHLSKDVETVHEELAHIRISSGSINGLLYRGAYHQELYVPKLLSLVGLLPKELKVNGPEVLSLGALSQYNPTNDWNKASWKRMGVNNDFTVKELTYLIQHNRLPAFTLAYLPDADAPIHKKGPNDTSGLVKTDQALQEILNGFDSWEKAVEEVTWIILGDSGQSAVKEEKETALIDLNVLLKEYTFWEQENKDGQLAIAINERMAYVYLKDDKIDIEDVVEILQEDERIGFISWKDEETNYVKRSNGEDVFTFSPEGPYKDQYKQTWKLDGDISILDIKLDQDGSLRYSAYPDALARLNGALHSQNGKVIIVDAKPGYEFIEKHSHDHAGGGAHGSLHKSDSVVPLIVVGETMNPPSNRLVDIKKWIVQMLSPK